MRPKKTRAPFLPQVRSRSSFHDCFCDAISQQPVIAACIMSRTAGLCLFVQVDVLLKQFGLTEFAQGQKSKRPNETLTCNPSLTGPALKPVGHLWPFPVGGLGQVVGLSW